MSLVTIFQTSVSFSTYIPPTTNYKFNWVFPFSNSLHICAQSHFQNYQNITSHSMVFLYQHIIVSERAVAVVVFTKATLLPIHTGNNNTNYTLESRDTCKIAASSYILCENNAEIRVNLRVQRKCVTNQLLTTAVACCLN